MSKEFIVDGQLKVEEDALEKYEEGISLNIDFIPIREITYKSNNGFGTYLAELANNGDNPPVLNVKGVFVRPLDLGQTYCGVGEINSYRGQKQFKVTEVKKITPKGKRGIISFLKSLNGMKYQAEIIWDMYGENSLNIIKEHPLNLMTIINGAYPELLLDWKKQIDNIKDDYDYLNKLMVLGLRSEQAKALYDKYGMLIFEKLNENPYFLSKEIRGYGFKRCDAVAKKIGIEINNSNRLAEGIIEIIKNIVLNGDTYILRDELTQLSIDELSLKMTIPEMKKALKNLESDGTYIYEYGKQKFVIDGFSISNQLKIYKNVYGKKQKESCKIIVSSIDKKDIEDAYKVLVLEDRIVIEDDRIYDKEIYLEEISIANYIKDFSSNFKKNSDSDLKTILSNYCNQHVISLEEKQKEVVYSTASGFGGIYIITGAAGCGKTFCIKIALDIMEKMYVKKQGYFSKIIIAPTGKASRVAAKATGIEASTIHKALIYQPGGGFYYNINNKLPYDCIVIDESSMLDCNLAYMLFSAIAPTTKIILMGDTHQLPSIGAGNILRDIILSNKVPVITLNVIKRQGLDSGIVINSHRIINGEMVSSNKQTMDSLIYKADNDIEYVEKILKSADKLVAKYGINGMQVLSPQRTGPQGTNYLNFILQERFNKTKSSEKILKQTFEVEIDGTVEQHELYLKAGDKVINTKNNYSAIAYQLDKEGHLIVDNDLVGITNGETGIIVKIISKTNEYNEWESIVIVKFEDKFIVYENNFDDLELCYAMTIHKSQGSEWSGVILIISPNQKYMLDKNIFYTGLTRAKEMSIVVSDVSTLKYAINKDSIIKRKTGLSNRIIKAFDK